MKPLVIEGGFKFPSIDFNPNSGLLKITGRSIPEDPVKLYQPLEDWISGYIQTALSLVLLLIAQNHLIMLIICCLGSNKDNHKTFLKYFTLWHGFYR